MSSAFVISIIDSIKRAFAFVELVEYVEESGGVGEVFAQVSDSLALTSFFEVVVDPSDQDLFGLKLLNVLELFTILSKTPNLRGVLKGDGLGNDESESLPDEGKDEMGSLLDEILG